MQRSQWLVALAVLACLAGVLSGTPRAGALPALAPQPITVTASALQRIASDPTNLTFELVTQPLQPGAKFFYQFDVAVQASVQTPITLTATFDPRLDGFSIGGDGACSSLSSSIHTLVCRDQFADTWQSWYPHMSLLWIWFTVLPSSNKAPIVMTVTTAYDSNTITLAYDGIVRSYFPVFRH